MVEVERAIYFNAEEPIGSARFHSLTQGNKEWVYMICTHIGKI